MTCSSLILELGFVALAARLIYRPTEKILGLKETGLRSQRKPGFKIPVEFLDGADLVQTRHLEMRIRECPILDESVKAQSLVRSKPTERKLANDSNNVQAQNKMPTSTDWCQARSEDGNGEAA